MSLSGGRPQATVQPALGRASHVPAGPQSPKCTCLLPIRGSCEHCRGLTLSSRGDRLSSHLPACPLLVPQLLSPQWVLGEPNAARAPDRCPQRPASRTVQGHCRVYMCVPWKTASRERDVVSPGRWPGMGPVFSRLLSLHRVQLTLSSRLALPPPHGGISQHIDIVVDARHVRESGRVVPEVPTNSPKT